jgi:porphobilinogen synthase
MSLIQRARRLRSTPAIRSLVQETHFSPSDMIAPLFVQEADGTSLISSMPGIHRFGIKQLITEARELYSLGIKSVALFPAINDGKKSSDCKEAWNPDNLNFMAARALKEALPDLLIMGDIALDPYSSDGHDGLVDPKSGEILNDETLEALVKQSLASAKAGFDILGPSDMMDGRVAAMRNALEESGFKNTLIMSYTAKYASAFYGPFRDALSSAPKKGDKKTYQMDPANSLEAIKEAQMDEAEGADILMVKPGISYLDIIYRLKEFSTLPIAAYNVSGEYAMVKAAHERGWVDGDKVMMEMLLSFKRAGSDIILTYFAKDAAKILNA